MLSGGLSGPMQGLPMGVAGTGFAAGGGLNMDMTKGPHLGRGIKSMTKGTILSDVPGRTDAHATHVPSGSYVIPADIVSGRGQGNTIAGAKVLEQLFKMGPYGSSPGKMGKGSGKKFAEGGPVEGAPEEVPVRVNLAGGEIVVPPENLMALFGGDLKTAHELMDAWVLTERKKLRKTLAKLPGPVKD